MKIVFHKKFEKDFKKLDPVIKKKFIEKKAVFEKDPSSHVLKNHQLFGEYLGYRSINITNDYRALYYFDEEKDVYVFVRVGTHSQLYK